MRVLYHFALYGHNLFSQPFHCCKLINESHTIKESKSKVFNYFFVEFYFATCVQCVVQQQQQQQHRHFFASFGGFAAPMHVLLLLLLLLLLLCFCAHALNTLTYDRSCFMRYILLVLFFLIKSTRLRLVLLIEKKNS